MIPQQVPLHGSSVVVQAKAAHGMADVIAVDRLPPLSAAPLGGLAGDESPKTLYSFACWTQSYPQHRLFWRR